jgi:hypothetical protein
VIGVEGGEGLVEEGLLVLEPVGLVDLEDGPGERAQLRLVLEQDLVGGEEGLELGAFIARVDSLARADDSARGDVTTRKDLGNKIGTFN